MRRLLAIVVGGAFGACAVVTQPRGARLEPPRGWREAFPASKSEGTLSEQWWKGLGDPQLDSLVQRALEASPDIRIALARVEQARAAYRLAQADQEPLLRASAGVARQRTARVDALVAAAPEEPAPKLTRTRLNLGLDFSYEVDLWGRWSAAAGAAVADVRAAETDVQAVKLQVAAEVARQYVVLAQLDALAQVESQTIAIAEEQRGATGRLMEAGLAGVETQLEIDREIDRLRGLRAGTERARAQTRHRLAALLGLAPVDVDLAEVALSALQVPEVPADLPSALLRRRPDLGAAEARLEAASLRAEAARRARFPEFSLTAAWGLASDTLKRLVRGDAAAWSIVPQLAAPLLGRGRVEARGAATRADLLLAQESYRQAALNAFAEVEDALSAVASAAEAEDIAKAILASRRHSEALAVRQVAVGRLARPNALVATAAVLSARGDLDRARADRLLATLDLVRSLGGGSCAMADPQCAPPGPAPKAATSP